ncbi:hypothetical protein HPB52_023485 [Rhipicephalus sanguineus]|uniref:Uncharacterized protein n=1 Tax=Rhipicephalus sanguineus TaxID=34632 RepID=A0A9D4YQV7_RHISA|nr:hypothetical protein HPB52_023485 [Rhipicephalus sanguineus]
MDRRQRALGQRRHPYPRPPPSAPHRTGPQHTRHYPRACPTCGIVRPLDNVAKWTVVSGQTSVGWVSRLPTVDQPEFPLSLRGRDVPEPFRGLNVEDHHPREPGASYTEEERRLLCALCGVPEIHRRTHLPSPLHAERAAAERARHHVPTDEETVTQALLVLRNLRPDLLVCHQAIKEDVILDIDINDV